MKCTHAEHIALLNEEVEVLSDFTTVWQRLHHLDRRREDGANAEIEELNTRIKSLEGDITGMGEVDGHRLEKLNDAKLENTGLRTALYRIQTELQQFLAGYGGGGGTALSNIYAIATEALGHEEPKPEETTDGT